MRFLVALFLGALLAASPAYGADAGSPAGDGPRVAVLRLADVLLGFKMYTDGIAGLKKDRDDGQTKIDALQERMKSLDGSMQVLNRDSDLYASDQLEFEQLKVKVKMIAEHGTQLLSNRRANLVRSCFASVRTSLQAYCQANGIKLVHLAPNPDLEGADNQELNQALMMQSVLYYDPALDITDAFIPFLNERWNADLAKAHASAPSSPPAATPDPPPQSATQGAVQGGQAK
jgi:Skp family chaperone for outer membrane proteins